MVRGGQIDVKRRTSAASSHQYAVRLPGDRLDPATKLGTDALRLEPFLEFRVVREALLQQLQLNLRHMLGPDPTPVLVIGIAPNLDLSLQQVDLAIARPHFLQCDAVVALRHRSWIISRG